MAEQHPHHLVTFIEQMHDQRRTALLNIYKDYNDLIHIAKGSTHNHQAWDGGYGDHVAECLMINDRVYDALSSLRPLPFTKDSAAIALFFNDIEKPFKNIKLDDPRVRYWQDHQAETGKSWEEVKWDIIENMKKTYDFDFTNEELNALKYTHGEGDDYRKDRRISTPLAAHVHHCDNTSARIWYNYGQEQRNARL